MNKKLFATDVVNAVAWTLTNVIFGLSLVIAFCSERGVDQAVGWVCATIVLVFVGWYATLHSIPTVFWRYRDTLETRILLAGNKYSYAQMKLLGMWFNFIVNAKDNNVRIALFAGPTFYEYGHKHSYKAEAQIDELAKFMRMGRTPGAGIEVMARKNIVKGVVE